MDADPPVLRDLQPSDVRTTARLHRTALSDGFLVKLGESFLRQYHLTFLHSPFASARVADVGGDATGFLVGVLEPGLHGQWVVRHRGARLLWRAALALLLRPRLLTHFLHTRARRYASGLLRRLRGQTVAVASGDGPPAVLSHIAIDPAARGTGTGRRLVEDFETQVRRAGVTRIVVATERRGGAEDFYLRLGYEATTRHAQRQSSTSSTPEWITLSRSL